MWGLGGWITIWSWGISDVWGPSTVTEKTTLGTIEIGNLDSTINKIGACWKAHRTALIPDIRRLLMIYHEKEQTVSETMPGKPHRERFWTMIRRMASELRSVRFDRFYWIFTFTPHYIWIIRYSTNLKKGPGLLSTVGWKAFSDSGFWIPVWVRGKDGETHQPSKFDMEHTYTSYPSTHA